MGEFQFLKAKRENLYLKMLLSRRLCCDVFCYTWLKGL